MGFGRGRGGDLFCCHLHVWVLYGSDVGVGHVRPCFREIVDEQSWGSWTAFMWLKGQSVLARYFTCKDVG